VSTVLWVRLQYTQVTQLASLLSPGPCLLCTSKPFP